MSRFQEKIEMYYPFLDDIRRRITIVGIYFLISFIGGFFVTAPLFRLFAKFFVIPNVTIITVSPFQFIDLAMNTGITIALIISLPVFVYQFFSFLKTGLTIREQVGLVLYLPTIILLFLLGFAYGFFTLYSTFGAIANINTSIGIQNYWDISKLLSQIFLTSALLGIIFQFPLVLTGLIKMKLFDVRYLKSKRRHAVAFIFFGTSLLPPTDGVSLIVMVLPLLLLYEVTIMLNNKNINSNLIH